MSNGSEQPLSCSETSEKDGFVVERMVITPNMTGAECPRCESAIDVVGLAVGEEHFVMEPCGHKVATAKYLP